MNYHGYTTAEDMIGERVIVKSNNDEPYKVGIFLGMEKMNPEHKTSIPVIEIDGEKTYCMGVILPYYISIRDFLKPLTPEQQWNFCVNLKSFILRINNH